MSCDVGQRCQNSRSLTPVGGWGVSGLMSSFITLTKHQSRLLPGNSPPRGGSRQTFGGWRFSVKLSTRSAPAASRQPPAPFPPPPLSLFEQRACGALFCSVALSRWRGEHRSGARPSSHRGFLSRLKRGTRCSLHQPDHSVCFPPQTDTQSC